ncbi:MAG: hypothetical protein B6226_03320 [Candidatus Cloacimonetes bacterium 4572_65]|nr:MAG: hypothetical protein B6226_03320 [Candidatus Cloacimonetes bacterium 4572_65]
MIYLDNAATSYPKAPGVADGVATHIRTVSGNAGRSSYKDSITSSTVLFETRELISTLFGLKSSDNIIFTLNATHALNIVILGSIKREENILISPFEHNSVLRPLSHLVVEKKIKLHRMSFDNNFNIDLETFEKSLIEKQIDKVIMTACSNVTGTILPFKELALISQKHNIPFILDASQYMGYIPIDFTDIPVSAVCFPGHKGLLGPAGTGILYFSDEFKFNSLYYGGTGSNSSSIIQPTFSPDMYESGTANISGIYGLKIALEYLEKEGLDKIRSHRVEMINQLAKELSEIEEIDIQSNLDIKRQIGVFSITSKGISASELTYWFDKNDIAVRMGLHCAPETHKFLHTFDEGGTVRLSPGYFTTPEDIEKTINKLKEEVYVFNR